MKFGDQLRFVRNKLGMSQRKFAEELEVSIGTINRLENNLNSPNFRTEDNFYEYCKRNKIKFYNEIK